ncbi:hypothetical protein Esti_004634 [Eimeria stiedai]
MQSLRHLCQNALHLNSEIEIGGRSIRIERQLAEGGYAYVWLARDSKTDELFALKRLPYSDAEGLACATRERDVLASLPPHENVVRCHGSLCAAPQGGSRGSGEVLLLLDYCRGGSLLDLLNRREKPEEGLDEPVIRRVLLHVALALSHLHSQTPPVVHCDLKAENILWGPPPSWGGPPQGASSLSLGALWSRARGQLAGNAPAAETAEGLEGVFRLCDFGSCMRGIVDPSQKGREEKLQIGEAIERHTTLAYRAPEMVDLYLDIPVGPAADVWMLGCVLFVLCFCRHPFEEASALAISNAAYQIPKNHNRPTAAQLAAALAAPEGVRELLQQQQKQQQKPQRQQQQQQQKAGKGTGGSNTLKTKETSRRRTKEAAAADEDFAFDPCAAAPVCFQQRQQQQQHAPDPWGQVDLLQGGDPWQQPQAPQQQQQQQQQKQQHQQRLPLQAADSLWEVQGSCGPQFQTGTKPYGSGDADATARYKSSSSSSSISSSSSSSGETGSGKGACAPQKSALQEQSRFGGYCVLDGFPSPHCRDSPAAAAAAAARYTARGAQVGSPSGKWSPCLSGHRGSLGFQGSQQQHDLLLEQMLVMREQILPQQEQQQHGQQLQQQVSHFAAWTPPSPLGRIPTPRGPNSKEDGSSSSSGSGSSAAAAAEEEARFEFSLKNSFDRGLLRLWERKPQPAAPPAVQLSNGNPKGV